MAKDQENKQPSTYQTGVTDPPKRHGGLIAALFMAVIFLCGIITGLSAMNIKLFQQVSGGENQRRSMTFTRQDGVSVAAYNTEWELAEEAFWGLGFVGRELSAVYRNYYELPEGVYICQVDTNSRLGLLGLQPGDVLVQVDNTPITNLQDAKTALSGRNSGTLTVCRAGQQITITF